MSARSEIGELGVRRTFHLSMSSVSHGFSVLWVEGIVNGFLRFGELCDGADYESVFRTRHIKEYQSRRDRIRLDLITREFDQSKEDRLD